VNDGSFAPCAIYAARSSKPREHRRQRHATGAGNRDRHHHDGTGARFSDPKALCDACQDSLKRLRPVLASHWRGNLYRSTIIS
jgi:hypothetical protein